MQSPHIRLVLPMIITIAFMLSAHWLKLWPVLGAHAYWSASATYIGGGIGVLIGAITILTTHTKRRILLHLGVFIVLAGIFITASKLGKMDFVASYAEDRGAGKVWYFGFMAFIGASSAALVVLIRALWPK